MTNAERRQFNRVLFKSSAILIADTVKVDCEIIDLSLHGALVKLLAPIDLEAVQNYQLDIPLTDDGELISMALRLTHQENDQLGLECTHIDLDSITHLRRLVELNLGDSELLERDFHSLVKDDHQS